MGGEPLTKDQLRKYVSDGDKWIKTLGRLNPEFSNSYDDALLIGKNLNEKDVQNLENNSTVLISENYEECETIISGQDGCDENKVLIVADHRIHISIEERKEVDGYNWNKTFIRFLPADNQGPTLEYSVDEFGRHFKHIQSTDSSYEGFELQMLDKSNPHLILICR